MSTEYAMKNCINIDNETDIGDELIKNSVHITKSCIKMKPFLKVMNEPE